MKVKLLKVRNQNTDHKLQKEMRGEIKNVCKFKGKKT